MGECRPNAPSLAPWHLLNGPLRARDYRTVVLRTGGHARQPLLSKEGPAKMVETKGYSTTIALSIFRKLNARAVLRRGTSETVAIPASRDAERVFGVSGPGRSKRLPTGPSVAQLRIGYDPRSDSCVSAFVRIM